MAVALITGAADRLGRAMALRLAEMGYDVAVHYARSKDKAQGVVSEIEAKGRIARAFQADLLDLDAAEALIPQVAEMGQLSVLINNASIFEHDTVQNATREGWDRHMRSNLQAPFILTQGFAAQAADAVIDARGEPVAQACIINMADQRVRKLTPEFATYTLAKSTLWTLTQTAARGLAPHIRVNAIGPGPTLVGGRQSQQHFDAQRAACLLGRGSDPEDIVETMDYLIRSKAVTGQLICVDGGQHLGWQTPDVLGVE